MIVGTGIFIWRPLERQSDRYGGFYLANSTYEGAHPGYPVKWDVPTLISLRGQRIRVTATVLESRKSGHIGDLALSIRPTQPDVGEVIELGVGTLALDDAPKNAALLLVPSDGRQVFWMDPRKFYRLHDQTVALDVEITDDPDHPKPDLTSAPEGVYLTEIQERARSQQGTPYVPIVKKDSN